MYYVELKENKITGKGFTGADIEMQENQREISEEIYEQITRMPAEIETDKDGSIISVTNAPVPQQTQAEIKAEFVKKIRERYGIEDEIEMLRIGIIDKSEQAFVNYLQYVSECVEWQLQKK